MTLILTCLTSQVVIQASDQRLTDPISGAIRDEYANKAVVHLTAMAYAYTGISRIPDAPKPADWTPTDRWVAQRMGEHNLSQRDALRAIGQGLADSVGERFPLAIVGGGFAWIHNDGADRQPLAMYYQLSNCLDKDGNFSGLRPQFKEVYEFPPIERTGARRLFFVREAGQRLSKQERASLKAKIRLHVRKDGMRPDRIEAELVAAIRAAADRLEDEGNPCVGRSIVATSLPRAAFVNNDMNFGSQAANLDYGSCRYYPEDATVSEQLVPNLVVPGFGLITGLTIDWGDPDRTGFIFGT